MSGTYTQTPNLGLYKPTPNSDTGTWGYHLNSNADILDHILGNPGGTSFLPISGGTLTGTLVLAANATAGLQAVTYQQLTAGYLALAGGTVTGPTTFTGPVTLPPTTTGAPWLLLAGGTVTGTTTFSATGTGLSVTNNATVGGTLAVTGASTLTGAVTFGSPVTLPTGSTGPFLPIGGGTVTGATTFSGTGTGLSVTTNAAVTGTFSSGAATFSGNAVTSGTAFFQAGSPIGTYNSVRISPAAAGTHTVISVIGPDTNTYVNFSLQGSGYVQVPKLYANAGTVTLSGAAVAEQTPVYENVSYAGTATDNRNLNLFNIAADNAAVSGTATSMNGWTFSHRYGGAAMTGGRIAFNVGLTQSAATANTGVFYQAVAFTATATQPEAGGSTPTLNTHSQVFAMGNYAVLQPTATGYSALVGYEQDVIVGAQPYQVLGFNAVRLSGGYSTLYQAVEPSLDSAYRIGSSVYPNPTWINGYTITGPSGQWALDTVNGRCFMAFPGQNYATVKPAAASGIDLSYVAFSQYAWHSQGAKIDGSGNAFFAGLNLGNWKATVTGTGLSLDSPNQIALTAAVAAGGTTYSVNEQFSFAGNGRGIVTAQTSGVVSTIQILEYPTASSPPANPVATTSLMFAGAGQQTGSGLTLNLTWTAANMLSLNPSGGPVTAPTPTAGDNSTRVATTAFVAAASGAGGVTSWNTRTGAVTLSNADVVTVLPGSSTTPLMNGTAAIGTATTWAHADHVHPTDTSLAPIASPTFTGTPAAPTPAAGTSNTQIATTAFVAAAIPFIATTTGAVSVTGTTAETILISLRIPANTIGKNGLVEIKAIYTYTNSSNNKTLVCRFGSASGVSGTNLPNMVVSTSLTAQLQWTMRANNATNAQVYFGGAPSVPFGVGTAAFSTNTVDTTADSYINLSGILTVGTETITLTHAMVTVYPHAN